MWKVIRLDMKTGASEELASFGEAADAEAHFSSLDHKEGTIVVWDGTVPKSDDAMHEIADEILRINEDRVSRVMIGMHLEDVQYVPSAMCPTRCFCVVAHGQRRCEGPYHTPIGTIWVYCGVDC